MIKIKNIVALFLVTTLFISVFTSCGKRTNSSNLSYSDVLEICCDAINQRDDSIISDFIYEDFGEEWNTEMIVNSIYDFEEENLPLENRVEGYESYDSQSELEELQSWIFEDTNVIVDIQKGMEIGMDNGSCMEIFLVMVEERWYIYYFDL